MNQARYRKLARHLALLWLVGVLFGWLASVPALRAAPEATDADVFRPGALLLVDILASNRAGFLRALTEGLGVTLIGSLFLLSLRSVMTGMIADLSRGGDAARPYSSRLGAYFASSFCQLIALGLLFGASGLALKSLLPKDGSLEPTKVAQLAVLLGISSFLYILICVIFDLWKLALFGDSNFRERIRKVVRALRPRAVSLFALRGLRTILTLALSALILRACTNPWGEGFAAASLTLVLSQLAVLASLFLEAFWLYFGAQTLSDENGPLPSDASGDGVAVDLNVAPS